MPSIPAISPASFLDLLLDAVCVVDVAGRFVFVSAACEQIFGYTPEEMIGAVMIDMVAPEDRERTLQAAGRIMTGQTHLHFQNRYVRKDGRLVHIMWSARWSEADQLRIAVARDVTASQRIESMQVALYAISEAAHAAEDLLSLIREIHLVIGRLLPAPCFAVALGDGAGGHLDFAYYADDAVQGAATPGPALRALCAEVVRTGQPLLVTDATMASLPQALQALVEPAWHNWLGVPLRSGEETIGVLALQSEAAGAPFAAPDQELLQFVSTQVATAIQRKQLHAQLQHMAQYDDLTGLPNRRLLLDRLKTALARATRQQGCLCVLYLDLNEFKQVNDRFGHDTGDLVLREVAGRLAECVRGADTVARLGGDEFVVVLENLARPEQAAPVVDKIRAALGRPVDVGGGYELRLPPSVGIAFYPEHGSDSQQLLKHADEAMYAEKKRGRRGPGA